MWIISCNNLEVDLQHLVVDFFDPKVEDVLAPKTKLNLVLA